MPRIMPYRTVHRRRATGSIDDSHQNRRHHGPGLRDRRRRSAGLFEAGVDVCRLNFSHGALDEHLQMLRNIREAAARWDQPIAILGDLCGPKIRLGKVADVDGTGGMPINVGDELIIQREPIVGADGRVSTIYPHFVDDVQVGDRVLIEDGLLRFVCTDKNADELRCNCTGRRDPQEHQGHQPARTRPSTCRRSPIAIGNASTGRSRTIWITCALSFVRKADDLQLLREHLANKVAATST